jgi:glycosyltransferase involved in cell wall biosynthesis
MINNTPLVSIIIPTYNRGHVLKNAINSALNQTYKNIEIIVIDDGSTDDTNEVLNSYMDKIRYIQKPYNTGKSYSRNIGLANSSGSIIATIDSDDVWHYNYLERCINYLLAENLDIIFATCVGHGFNHKKLVKKHYHVFKYDEIRNLVLHYCPAPTSGVIMKKTAMAFGWHNETMEYEDWYLQIECIVKNKNCRTGFISETLWEKREDEEVKSKLKSTQQNLHRTNATFLLLNRLKGELTQKEFNIIQQNYFKDTIRLLMVLIRNREYKKEIWKNIYLLFSSPIQIISLFFKVVQNKIL